MLPLPIFWDNLLLLLIVMKNLRSIYDYFLDQVKAFPDKPAVIVENRVYTYSDLYILLHLLEKELLLKRKFEISDLKIALFLDNDIEIVLLLLLGAKKNYALVPLPPSLPQFFAEKILKLCDVNLVISKENFYDFFENLAPLINNPKKIKNLSFQIEADSKTPLGKFSLSKEYIITTTSGSTGEPKPIVLTQKTKLLRAFLGAKEIFNLSEKDTFIVSTPLYHSLAQRFVLLPLMIGAKVVIVKKFHPELWIDKVKKYKVSFAPLVSSQLETLSEILEKSELHPIKLISSSAPLLENTREKLIALGEKLPIEIYETYGTSEVGFVSILNLLRERNKWKSVGKPLPYVRVKIRKINPKEEIGEISVKTPTIFAGYYKMPEKTRESMDEEGYFLTGDLGFIDEEGYLYFSGRAKEIIITGGINVYPQDVERVILQYPYVKECAVFGVPAPRLGEIVASLIVPKDRKKFNIFDFKKFLREHLAVYQYPLIIKLVDNIPKNALGKVVRRELKNLISEEEIKKALKVFNMLK